MPFRSMNPEIDILSALELKEIHAMNDDKDYVSVYCTHCGKEMRIPKSRLWKHSGGSSLATCLGCGKEFEFDANKAAEEQKGTT